MQPGLGLAYALLWFREEEKQRRGRCGGGCEVERREGANEAEWKWDVEMGRGSRSEVQGGSEGRRRAALLG